MVCELWKIRLDTYLDDELSPEEMHAFDAHLQGCASCSGDALARVQMKRAIKAAGQRFSPTAEFRKKIEQRVRHKSRHVFPAWILAAAASVLLILGSLSSNYLTARSERDRVFSEIADLHVATLASSSPVDVVSTDRHTVKPWFQGKIPFAFDLPELHDTGFTLLGGRMAYLRQTPGAEMIYDIGKHHISVFIFPGQALRDHAGGRSTGPKELPLRMETWSQGGLRYFIAGDASTADIDQLAKLFKAD